MVSLLNWYMQFNSLKVLSFRLKLSVDLMVRDDHWRWYPDTITIIQVHVQNQITAEIITGLHVLVDSLIQDYQWVWSVVRTDRSDPCGSKRLSVRTWRIYFWPWLLIINRLKPWPPGPLTVTAMTILAMTQWHDLECFRLTRGSSSQGQAVSQFSQWRLVGETYYFSILC